jgi:hypothetical protein
MCRAKAAVISVVVCLAFSASSALGAGPVFTAGAAGAGDPYFPNDGNGGYDVGHYDLDLTYEPGANLLTGVATITARATQNLSRFDLDEAGLTIRSISVNGATSRGVVVQDELRITPPSGLPNGTTFTTIVTYTASPQPHNDGGSLDGFFPTDDGVLVAGEPHGAETWFPVNNHPTDKASYTFHVRAPTGLQGVANGRLIDSSTSGDWTTWTWNAPEPMASYLAMFQVGHFDVHAYQEGGIRYWDAIDPDLLNTPAAPRTGSYFALSQSANAAYKRLMTTISVPATGATLSFWANRDTEFLWDFLAVEAHHPGLDDWTTLPDANGHTSTDGGGLCRFSSAHPFLAHYFAADYTNPDDVGCIPTGTTGSWHAASGSSGGSYEDWAIDLGAYAGGNVEVAISVISDESFALPGVFLDDVDVSTGQGSTSFEGGTLSPWTVPGAPDGSPGNANDWIPGTAADVPPDPTGVGIKASMSRQPQILRFESSNFGPYPFSTGGGIVDDYPNLGFALETQTRPVYSRGFFADATGNDFVFVHELAHQWFGDSVALGRWQDVWLNEGFATYAELLWSENQGFDTVQANYDFWLNEVPPDDAFWALAIGDPGPNDLFDFPVYVRGALTLHALRLEVGDRTFFRILKSWAGSRAGGNGTTPEFIALAEQLSGRDLEGLFATWLGAGYPIASATVGRAVGAAHATSQRTLEGAPAAARSEYIRYGKRSDLFKGG